MSYSSRQAVQLHWTPQSTGGLSSLRLFVLPRWSGRRGEWAGYFRVHSLHCRDHGQILWKCLRAWYNVQHWYGEFACIQANPNKFSLLSFFSPKCFSLCRLILFWMRCLAMGLLLKPIRHMFWHRSNSLKSQVDAWWPLWKILESCAILLNFKTSPFHVRTLFQLDVPFLND